MSICPPMRPPILPTLAPPPATRPKAITAIKWAIGRFLFSIAIVVGLAAVNSVHRRTNGYARNWRPIPPVAPWPICTIHSGHRVSINYKIRSDPWCRRSMIITPISCWLAMPTTTNALRPKIPQVISTPIGALLRSLSVVVARITSRPISRSVLTAKFATATPLVSCISPSMPIVTTGALSRLPMAYSQMKAGRIVSKATDHCLDAVIM